jgi:hypothetical protein
MASAGAARQVVGRQHARQRPATRGVADQPTIYEVLRELQRLARIAERELMNLVAEHAEIGHVAEQRGE